MSMRTFLIAKSIKDLKEDVLIAETKMMKYAKMADEANYKSYLLNKKLEESDIERTKQQEQIDWLTLRCLHYNNDMKNIRPFLKSLSEMFCGEAGDASRDINDISNTAKDILKSLKT